jgi:hypothetical protein
MGIKQNQEKIFHSFVQEDLSTTKIWWNRFRFGNFNQLLELMNSKLLKSKYGKGSDFHFLIDFRKSERRRHHSSISSPNNNKTQPIEYLDNTRILIVEDNKINMLLAKNW